MPRSIKQGIGGSKLGGMNEIEVKRLLDAALSDLAALRTCVNSLATDVAKISNNTNAANNTVQLAAASYPVALNLTA